MVKEVVIKPIYNADSTRIVATEKTVKIFGITVIKKRVESPLIEIDEYWWCPSI